METQDEIKNLYSRLLIVERKLKIYNVNPISTIVKQVPIYKSEKKIVPFIYLDTSLLQPDDFVAFQIEVEHIINKSQLTINFIITSSGNIEVHFNNVWTSIFIKNEGDKQKEYYNKFFKYKQQTWNDKNECLELFEQFMKDFIFIGHNPMNYRIRIFPKFNINYHAIIAYFYRCPSEDVFFNCDKEEYNKQWDALNAYYKKKNEEEQNNTVDESKN